MDCPFENARPAPRLLIAGLCGGSGKTLVSMGLLLLLRREGIPVRAFKKGPDYIDTAWLKWASGDSARNLDTCLMGAEVARASFQRHALPEGVNLIEGNRGLFDGFDAAGTHSSAALAQVLDAPVVLVLDATKMTRTAAALVLGCQVLDPTLRLAGVILNNVAGRRHEQILRSAVESACSVPVLGALSRGAVNPVPERHLGLVPPQEHDALAAIEERLLDLVEERLDLKAILSIARAAPPLAQAQRPNPTIPDGHGLRIGYVEDPAFNFYYPENLEALRDSGADVIRIPALDSSALPEDLDLLYIGGGFPETHARALSANTSFLTSLHQACAAGLPVYAECGGLMLLAQRLLWRGTTYEMAGVLPIDVEVCAKPQGHGYTELAVDTPNPFFPVGTIVRGHEFHYSRLSAAAQIPTACAVVRGAGCGQGRDGLLRQNVFAGYSHFHALATPEWARGMLNAAQHWASARGQWSVVSNQ